MASRGRGEFLRLTKAGEEIFLHATYIPVRDRRGKVVQVIEIALNITRQLRSRFDSVGRLNAIDRAQAIVEFGLDGTILTANENFCRAMGYSLDEITGRHHRMFVDPAFAESAEYREFVGQAAPRRVDVG